jgi:biotin carboxyl carrier protein
LKLQVTIEGKIYNVGVEVLEDDQEPRAASLPATPLAPIAFPPPQATAPAGIEFCGDLEKVSLSPVTGLVIRLYVEPGQIVAAGDLLLVLEAMKMETTITAQRDGTVKAVKVAAGDAVKFNQVLVEFE